MICVVSVDKLLSSEDGGGIFDDPPAITASVMMPPDHGDDEDDFDNLQSRKYLLHKIKIGFTLSQNDFGNLSCCIQSHQEEHLD